MNVYAHSSCCFYFRVAKVIRFSNLQNIEPTNAQFFCMNCSFWGMNGFGDLCNW